MSTPMTEDERLRNARHDLAERLSTDLQYALACGLKSEAVLIAKLIEATLTNTTNDLIIAIRASR